MRRMERSEGRTAAATAFRLASLALMVVCSVLFLSSGMAPAADKPERAPVNPEYLQWKAERDAAVAAGESTVKRTAEGRLLGDIPSPIDESYRKNHASGSSASAKASSYPSSYDLRDYGRVTPVRDQGHDCICSWAFGSFASLESAMLPGTQTDFSESHLLDRHGFDYGPCSGGYMEMAVAYLARWGGPIPENKYPYQYLKASKSLPATSPSVVMKPYHVQNIEAIAMTTDNVKSALMDSGAVSVSFYYDNSYYNSSSYGYYCDSDIAYNHTSAIIGWDDNYSKSNFTVEPSGDGAYLVRNSWGMDWGNNGYFWISYYDKSFRNTGFLFNKAESTANYNWIYQYDPLGVTTWAGYGSTTAWMANIFKGNPLGSIIKAVGFYAADDNTSYTLYIYNKVKTTVNSKGFPVVKPRSGTLVATRTGTATAGYHTIKLTEAAKVTAGKNFSVVIQLTTPDFNYPMAVETPFSGLSSHATAIQGQSYVSDDGISWGDLPKYDGWENTNVCLKAFGSK